MNKLKINESLATRALVLLDHRNALAFDALVVFLGLLLVLDEGPEHANFVVLVLLKVEAILLAEAHLQQVVIQALL